jgi:hypothetical protein
MEVHKNKQFNHVKTTTKEKTYKCINGDLRKIKCTSFLKISLKSNKKHSTPHNKKCQNYAKKMQKVEEENNLNEFDSNINENIFQSNIDNSSSGNILEDFFKFGADKIFDINFRGRVLLNQHSFDLYESEKNTYYCYNIDICNSILKICDLDKKFFVLSHSKACIDHRNKIQKSSKKLFAQYPPISYKCYIKVENFDII